MAGDLRGLVMEKAEHLSGHLKELLATGQEYAKTRFGFDLGLDPELYPSWVVLSAAAAGLLLLLALSWAAVCGAKRRLPVAHGGGGAKPGTVTPGKAQKQQGEEEASPGKTARPEEARKKNRKRAAEKKIQSNGQPVLLTHEEVKVTETVSKPPPPPRVKADKVQEVLVPAQVKKNKKKAKAEVKPAPLIITTDGKEPDEGAWETKVSNREKRQQRRKEKGSDDSGSPGGVQARKHQLHTEAPSAAAPGKKNRGNHYVSSSWKDESSANGPGWSNLSVKISPQIGSLEGGKGSGMPAALHYRPQSKPQSWVPDAKATWTDRQMKTDINSVSFTVLGLNTKDQISNSCDLQWANHPADDEWSALNRTCAVDPGSDWNAPSEHWGNYEEPPVLGSRAPSLKENLTPNKQVLEAEKEVEDQSEGAAKSKKRRKKKKRTEEEEAEANAEAVTVVTKPQELPVLSSKMMHSSISSSQKKAEPTAEPVKSTQKKKIRKET